MKILSALLMLIYVTDVISQPVINADWVPSPGDNFVMQKVNYDQLHFGLSGSGGYGLTGHNVTWDFSALSLQDIYDTIRYSGTTDTLIRQDMNGCNPLYWQGDNLMIGVSAYLSCNYNSQGPNNYFKGSNVFYHFPMNDSSVYTQVFLSSYNIGTGEFSTQVQNLGWGTLLLPQGLQFDSALLMVQNFDTICTVIDNYEWDYGYGYPSYSETFKTSSYQWIIPGTKNPVLTINAWVKNNVYYHFDSKGVHMTGTTDTLNTVYLYKNSFFDLTKKQNGNSFLFPNPTSGRFTIAEYNNTGTISVKVVTLLGERLKEYTITSQPSEIDISDLASGIYIILVSAEGQKPVTHKIVKE